MRSVAFTFNFTWNWRERRSSLKDLPRGLYILKSFALHSVLMIFSILDYTCSFVVYYYISGIFLPKWTFIFRFTSILRNTSLWLTRRRTYQLRRWTATNQEHLVASSASAEFQELSTAAILLGSLASLVWPTWWSGRLHWTGRNQWSLRGYSAPETHSLSEDQCVRCLEREDTPSPVGTREHTIQARKST